MPKVDEFEMRARVGEILNRWPAHEVGPARLRQLGRACAASQSHRSVWLQTFLAPDQGCLEGPGRAGIARQTTTVERQTGSPIRPENALSRR
jgi:hypothetical protein